MSTHVTKYRSLKKAKASEGWKDGIEAKVQGGEEHTKCTNSQIINTPHLKCVLCVMEVVNHLYHIITLQLCTV